MIFVRFFHVIIMIKSIILKIIVYKLIIILVHICTKITVFTIKDAFQIICKNINNGKSPI